MARGLIRAGRLREAQGALAPLGSAAPAEAHHLRGVIARLNGRLVVAEAQFRAALALAPAFEDAALELARLCNASGRYREAIACTRANAASVRPAQALLVERARAWQALDRPDERLKAREQIVDLYPPTASTLHNLAAALGDAGHATRAEAAVRKAMAMGGDAPETWLVLARALQSQNRFAEADTAFSEALKRRPGYLDALRDRAQLLWMSTGDIEQVLSSLEGWGKAIDPLALRKLKVRFVAASGDGEGAYRLLLSGEANPDAEVEALAARLALPHDAARGLAHARRAEAMSPGERAARRAVIDALLALGKTAEAKDRIDRELQAAPFDAELIAARWTAWRIEGDPRASALYDYDKSVLAQTIDTPAGWASLDIYLADLADALGRLHRFDAHPLDQSLRGGGQTSANLLHSGEPAIRAFPQAIDGPIRRYLRSAGSQTESRYGNEEEYKIAGMWSVRLRPGGFHHNHIHPQGYISSACYISVPDSVSAGGEARAGWLKFGQPPVADLPPEYFIQPAPGTLVLFPSYMWHGTVPFDGNDARLTIAFDIVQDPRDWTG